MRRPRIGRADRHRLPAPAAEAPPARRPDADLPGRPQPHRANDACEPVRRLRRRDRLACGNVALAQQRRLAVAALGMDRLARRLGELAAYER